METTDIVIQRRPGHHRVTLDRADRKNTLTPAMVDAVLEALAACERDPQAKAFLLDATGDCFCNGMDLRQAATADPSGGDEGRRFALLLDRLTRSSVLTIAHVQGAARGGGVGLMAACDFVFADERCEFSLPEVLWGLVPYLVAPFVIRRAGHRICRRMTLSTLPVTAGEALSCGLIDGLDPAEPMRLLRRLDVLPREALGRAKSYLHDLWPIDGGMLDHAAAELARTMAAPDVVARLDRFARSGIFPWEREGRPTSAPRPAS